METLSAILDYISRTNLFNFIVMVMIITFIIVKVDLNRHLNDMTSSVADKIEHSKEEKSKSEICLKEMEEVISCIGEEIEGIIGKSEENAKSIGEKYLLEAEKSVENINDNSQKLVSSRALLIKNDILKRISEASVEVARNHIINELNNNYDLHHKLIDESVEVIGEVNL